MRYYMSSQRKVLPLEACSAKVTRCAAQVCVSFSSGFPTQRLQVLRRNVGDKAGPRRSIGEPKSRFSLGSTKPETRKGGPVEAWGCCRRVIRPALVIQSDLFNETHASVTVVPLTSTLVDAPIFRLTVEPSPANGLRSLSQLMIDKITIVSRTRIAQSIGRLEDDFLLRVSRALALWTGIAT